MLIEKLPTITDTQALTEALRQEARDCGVHEDNADTFALGYLAAYVARLNLASFEAGGDDVRPLTDDEVDQMLVNVSIAKLERLLRDRKAQLAKPTPSERLDELEDLESDVERGPCAFPGCTIKRPKDDLFCEAHQDDGEFLP